MGKWGRREMGGGGGAERGRGRERKRGEGERGDIEEASGGWGESMRERQTDRQTDRQTETERHREREGGNKCLAHCVPHSLFSWPYPSNTQSLCGSDWLTVLA